MYDVIPESLSRARRGICPTCGAPLQLAESGRETRCAFCGGGSRLQYRLRAMESSAGALQRPDIKGATRWLRKQGSYEKCTCPGCGAEFDANTEQTIQTCKYCGAQSKLETRLVAITTEDVDEPQERTEADLENQRRDRLDYPWAVGIEQLVWRILHEPELMPRLALAMHFEWWANINHSTAHFLPWLLKHAMTDHDAVAAAISDAVGKLLCEGDPTLWPGVIQACCGVVFDTQAKRVVLSELALGKAVCVKTLIDAAEYAGSLDRDYACHALWGVNTLIGRNFDEHPVIAQIVLYRMFYVTGPVLGWALYTMRQSYLRGRYPWQTLWRAIDELGADRPEVVPHLLECFYVPPAESADDYRERLALFAKATSWGGAAAAAEVLGDPPQHDNALYAQAIAALDPWLNHEHAGFSARRSMYGLLTAQSESTAPAFDAWVKAHGEALDARFKREYIRRNKDTALLETSKPYYWDSDPKRPLDPEMERLLGVWNEGINAAVDSFRARQDELRPMRDEARKLEPPVFLRQGPATLPIKQAVVQAEQKVQEEEKRVEDKTAEMERLQNEYSQKVQQLSERMMANMTDQKLMMKLTAEMQKLSHDLQEKMQKLWDN
ncbi:MAG: hypothetical protein KF696_14970 [Planctomycetes bacterium]|nr:hypothetical protein [Planctomycetota bacterium]MCW8135869.1 hypothetical protein [Planctomycetota bacterium]